MISLHDKFKILGTGTVVLYESKRSRYVLEKTKSYLQGRICQSRLSVLTLHINFDADFNVERVKKAFFVKNICNTFLVFVDHLL